jgi:hypothetical protein
VKFVIKQITNSNGVFSGRTRHIVTPNVACSATEDAVRIDNLFNTISDSSAEHYEKKLDLRFF